MTELQLEKERSRQYLDLIYLLQDQLDIANKKIKQYEDLILSNISVKS
jgi:hypothetical protein